MTIEQKEELLQKLRDVFLPVQSQCGETGYAEILTIDVHALRNLLAKIIENVE